MYETVDDIVVSVVCLTFNHKTYIKDALDGFINQKTNFKFEVIVHDDASTDGTDEIIRSYAKKYPTIIKPIYQKENQWSKGGKLSKRFVYPLIKGKFVAFCEGDDYWVDPEKLQKQVDVFREHPNVWICFHPVEIKWENKQNSNSIYPSPRDRFYKTELSLEDLLKRNFIQTNSVMYRWRFHTDSLDQIPDNILPTDWYLHLLHAEKGTIFMLQEIMSVYRRHDKGVWYGDNKDPLWFKKCAILNYCFYDYVEKKFHVDREYEKKILIYISFIYAKKSNDKLWAQKLLQIDPTAIDCLKFNFSTYLKECMMSLICFWSNRSRAFLKPRIIKRCLLVLNKRKF